ncbi:hypothetical protein [Burkholderia ubonensis]|uniref:hypothetical protein n=1 Tax=Burkholderia ubonensis TaxID=101571 RepID=UPI0012F7AE3E|nr:hypothetical protein [Burkholderia ubonensis]
MGGTKMSKNVSKLLNDYHNFDDGLVVSFGFFYPVGEPPAAQGVFYAKNHSVPGDQWDTVAIVVKDIVEFNAHWKGNQPNSICTGVHLVRFGDLLCMDVDGVYGEVEDPKSIEEVRQFGDCYAIGRDVRFYVVNNRRVDLYAHLKHAD